MINPDKSDPTFDDLGESPVLSKLDALIRRHRPAGLDAPVLTEKVNRAARMSAGFPQLIDPDALASPSKISAEPILTFELPADEEPPLLLEIDEIEETAPVTSPVANPSIAPAPSVANASGPLPASPQIAQPPVVDTPLEDTAPPQLASDPLPSTPTPSASRSLYWEEEEAQPPQTVAQQSTLPEANATDQPATPSDSHFDNPPVTQLPPLTPSALDDTEAALELPVFTLMDNILQANDDTTQVSHHDEVPVLTELALEYDEQTLPLLDAHSRAEWVAEMVDDIIAEITPKIRALVRAQLGLQIGGLMKTVTDEVSKQLQESWRKELKRKIEKRVIAEVDANLKQHIIGQVAPDPYPPAE